MDIAKFQSMPLGRESKELQNSPKSHGCLEKCRTPLWTSKRIIFTYILQQEEAEFLLFLFLLYNLSRGVLLCLGQLQPYTA